MVKNWRYFLPFLLVLFVFACERNDDEPSRGVASVSRLYVSTLNYDANVSSIRNVFVIDPADSEEFPSLSGMLKFTSDVKGGYAIYYSDSTDLIFHSSYNLANSNDTTIQVLSASETGSVAQVAYLRNRRLQRVRGLAYSTSQEQLYAATIGRDTTSILAFNRPRNLRGYAAIAKEVMLDYSPWAIQLVGQDLLVTQSGTGGGVHVYQNFVSVLNEGSEDEVMVDMQPTYSLTISGASDIQGLAYSAAKDILVLTDLGAGNPKVYIIEGFSNYSASATITPTRIISGSSTNLSEPVNVAIDSREGSDWIYVADAGSRRVLRFAISDRGDIAPGVEAIVGASTDSPYTPVGVTLKTVAGDY